jgi:hypothetical protein
MDSLVARWVASNSDSGLPPDPVPDLEPVTRFRALRAPVATSQMRRVPARGVPPGLSDLFSDPQIVEVPHQRVDSGLHGEGLQHVLADEVSQIPHRFHGDGLVEELEGLLVLDAKPPPESPRVRWEASSSAIRASAFVSVPSVS